MPGLPRCHSMQFPRPKIYLEHLSSLIEKTPTVQPEVEINKKLFPQRSFAKKLALQSQRAKSNFQVRSKRYDVDLSPRRPTGRRSPPRVEHQTARGTLFRSGGSEQLEVRNGYFGSEESRFSLGKLQGSLAMTHSQQFAREERADSPRKEFLKKGSNIQKQIVVNLLRNKLLKEREQRKQREYSNQDIIKMIQVFKGVALVESRKGSRRVVAGVEAIKNGAPEYNPELHNIRGWDQQEQQTHEFMVREEPTEPPEERTRE